jgi:thioredoxin reductase (NADPH)
MPTSAAAAPRLTLLVRAYCHLCDEMREAVRPIADKAGLALQEIDVDSDPALEARWGTRVPVLLAGSRELCHYRLDSRALAAFLDGAKH